MKKHILFSALVLASITAQAQTQDKAYIVSNAHFDTQWNWDIQRSISEFIPKTMRNNIMLLEKYPNYVFNFEGAIKYAWMKEYYPFEYERVKDYVKQGRWHVTGSTWDANDTNIGSAEIFTRNILYGQNFYQKELGVKGTDIFLPDCFGFSYILPSISAHSGLIGFSTQKLMWRNNPFYGDSKIPFEIGLWEGIDGKRIMLVGEAHNYTTKWPDEDLSQNKNLKEIIEKSPIRTSYHYYGTGDTGGSPTIESVRAVEKGVNGKGDIKIISATSDQLYKDYLPYENHPELPVFKGELLMDVHGTGCYTSQAAMKLYNRRNENLSAAAERAAVMANLTGQMAYPMDALNENYKRFIFHQFHDDLTGTSIPRAYEFSWNDELLSLSGFKNILTSAAGSFSRQLDTQVKGTPVVLYNASGFAASEVVEIALPKGMKSAMVFDEKNQPVPAQLTEKNGEKVLLMHASVPALGYAVYDLRNGAAKQATGVKATANTLENSIYKLTFNANGDLSSIFDKRNNKELVESGKAVRLAMFTSNPSYSWPAWEIMIQTLQQTPVDVKDNVKISIVEQGPVRGAICVERTYGDSKIKQTIQLTEGGQSDRIDFVNEIDWATTDALLKAEFPLQVSNPQAAYDLGLGHIMRGNNIPQAYEVYAHQWADLTDKSGDYGVAVLNNGKYGWDKPSDNTFRLTLMHTPSTKGGYSYQSKQDFGHHVFTYSIVGHKGSLQENFIPQKAEELNQPVLAFVAPKHKGTLGRSYSLAQTSNPNVVLKAFKKAENEDAYIVRFYEMTGKAAQDVTFTLNGKVISAEEVNGMEETIGAATLQGSDLKFQMQPFGIKSFKVKMANSTLNATDCQPVALPFNLKAASYNAFRSTVNFDGKGASYAAELLPETLDFKGIRYQLSAPDSMNAVKCRGQEVALPAGNYNKVYLLAAATTEDQMGTFRVGNKEQKANVPYFSGFYGQWGHKDHTEAFLKNADVAFVGTHRHDMAKNADMPYEFTYMFSIGLDVPAGATTLTLPDNANIVVFAATAVNDTHNVLTPLSNVMGIELPMLEADENAPAKRNYVADKPIIEKSGEIHYAERAALALDDDISTKWCDISDVKNKYIVVDMEKEYDVTGWRVFHAGMESLDYIGKEYNLQVKLNANDDWQKVDEVFDNTALETDRLLKTPVKVRYVKLTFTKPDQSEGSTVRCYEFSVY